MNIDIVTIMSIEAVGGATTHINLLHELASKKGHIVRTVSYQNPSFLKRLGILSTSAFNRDVYRTRLVLSQVSMLNSMLKKSSAEIVHAHDALACLAAPTDRPLIWTVHGPLFEEAVMQGLATTYNRYGKMLLHSEMLAAKKAARIICVDQGQKDILRKRHPRQEHKMVVIPNTSNLIRSNSNFSETKYILCARRLVEKNGVEVAIRAFKFLTDRDIVLWIAGTGSLFDKLNSLVKDMGLMEKVKFLGEVRDREAIGQLTANATAILIPSIPFSGVIEATSISALEGMSLAKPVIASDIGGLSELIENDDTGILVPPGDTLALAKAIERLLEEPELCERLGKNARKAVDERFGPSKWISSVEEVYKEALEAEVVDENCSF